MNMNSNIDALINVLKKFKTNSTVKKTDKINSASPEILKKWKNCITPKDAKKIMDVNELRMLCNHFDLEEIGEKALLIKRLWEHWENSSDTESESDDESDDESGSDDENEDSDYESDDETE
jgi:hypothetical protein